MNMKKNQIQSKMETLCGIIYGVCRYVNLLKWQKGWLMNVKYLFTLSIIGGAGWSVYQSWLKIR